MAAGFDAHLTKPADPEQLTTLLAARFGSPAVDAASASIDERHFAGDGGPHI
jgi:CheY-like chemotaxis protein